MVFHRAQKIQRKSSLIVRLEVSREDHRKKRGEKGVEKNRRFTLKRED